MKYVSGLILLFFLYSITYAQEKITVSGRVIKGESEYTFNTQSGEILNFTSALGNISVQSTSDKSTYDKSASDNKVTIKLEKYAYGYKKADAEILFKKFSTNNSRKGKSIFFDIIFEPGDIIDLEVDVTIYIPENFNINLNTQSGTIDIPDITGNVRLFTGGGEIRCGNINGKLNVKSLGGSVKTKNIELDTEISTKGGSILLGNIGGNLDVRTSGGLIRTGRTAKHMSVKSGGGSIEILSSGNGISGSTLGGEITIGISAGPVEMITSGGNIKIDSVKSFVDVKTSGGSIELNYIEGYIDAETNGGEIFARLSDRVTNTDRHINLFSSDGGIEIHLPEKMKADLTARIDYQGGFYQNYEISSDVPLKKNNEAIKKDGESGQGLSLRGWAKLNGGGNPVILKTINGNIIIRTYK